MTDTIKITASTYVVGADDVLQFDDQYGFAVDGAGPSKLVSLGQVSVDFGDNGVPAFGLVDQSSARLSVDLRASSVFTLTAHGDAGATGFALSGSGSTIHNAGELDIHGGDGDTAVVSVGDGVSGIKFTNSGHVGANTEGMLDALILGEDSRFANSGVITLKGGGDVSYGVAATRFHNSGTLTLNAGMEGIGVQATKVFNTGHISVTADFLADGVELTSGGLFDNSGTIAVHILDGDQVALFVGNQGLDTPAHIHNTGTLLGGSAIVALSAVEIANSGKLLGELNLADGSSLDNSGVIHGGVLMGGGILNHGRIVGDIDFGSGDDRYDGSFGQLVGSLVGSAGDDTLIGGKGGDRIYGDDVFAAATDGADVLYGGKGDDTLNAGGSSDQLNGGAGADWLNGGRGADTLIGNAGADMLNGGEGRDYFVFVRVSDSAPGAADTIAKLEARDVVNLAAIDADATHGGNQSFHLVGALDGHAGQLALSYDAGTDTTALVADVDGDGAADFTVDIRGDASGFTNFVL